MDAVGALSWTRVDVELTAPFDISGGSHDIARLIIVELTLADGHRGTGEAAPLTPYNGETIADVEQSLVAIQSAVLERRFQDWRDLAPIAAEAGRASGSARCAFETALVDALARREGVSLSRWFGAAIAPNLETDVTIPIGPIDVARQAAAKWWSRGFRMLKIKVGAGDDFERVLAVHAAAPGASLILDGNAGLTPASALALVGDLNRRSVPLALFEQPLARDDWSGLRQLATSGVRLALDESVVTARDAERALRELGTPHVINIKLMKAGIAEALEVARVAQRGGMGLMIGGNVESALAMTTSACFAAGVGGVEFLDLDTPLFLRDSPLVGGFSLDRARIDLSPIVAGHGVELVRR